MGGLLILTAALVPTLLWADLTNVYVWIAVLTTAGFGAIGFADDYLKIVRRRITACCRATRWACSPASASRRRRAAVLATTALQHALVFPFFKTLIPDLGWCYLPFASFVLVAESNAVNLTDGLDGLAISIFAIAPRPYTALAYVAGNRVLADYLLLVTFRRGELTVFCGRWSARRSASFGTTRTPPKSSWATSARWRSAPRSAPSRSSSSRNCCCDRRRRVRARGAVGRDSGGSFKRPGKRVFRMAPLHHHFELIGWSEPKVITRFVIVAIIFALFSLTTLKLRWTFSVEAKRVTVAGAARSGLAAAELLARRGARVTLSESRRIAGGERCARSASRWSSAAHARDVHRADLVVLSPACRRTAARAGRARRGVPVIAEIELASRWLQGRVIAITGTKGKSTTTALTGRMLEAAGFKVTVGGNIGAPLSAQVSESTPDTLHVVETSSFQLEQIDTFHPWIAVMLNFSPDHLDRHPTSRRTARRRRGSSRTRTPRLGGDQRRRPGGAGAGAPRPRDARLFRARRRSTRARSSTTAGSSIGARARERLVPLDAIHLLGPHLVTT
jgi:phospho-N-acetylmuramoyl-pentapeptide-transferase